jgi:hypothetical protein
MTFLNEGIYCEAIIVDTRGTADGRGLSTTWKCGCCGKRAPFPLETRLRVSEKQCDYCLAHNNIQVNQ